MQNLAGSTPPSLFFHGCSPYTSEDLVYHLRPSTASADVYLISLCQRTFNTSFLDVNHIVGSLVGENRCKQNYAFIQVRMFSASIYSNLPLTAVIFLPYLPVGIVICRPIKCTMHL